MFNLVIKHSTLIMYNFITSEIDYFSNELDENLGYNI